MSITLIVERTGNGALPIALEDWITLVGRYRDLRLRREPYVVVNSKTGARISVAPGTADAELQNAGEWVPLLSFRRGTLVAKYQAAFDDPGNPIRIRIAEVAETLAAVITTDSGDEILSW